MMFCSLKERVYEKIRLTSDFEGNMPLDNEWLLWT